MATKTLHFINSDSTFEIESTDYRIKFYDFETNRAYTRKVWTDCIGTVFVWFNGKFQALTMQKLHKGMRILCGEYVTC